jgi:ABC-2 type transport system permease protein
VTPHATAAYRITGPGALTTDRRRLVHLTLTLAVTDWKLRFFGSVLGYVWSLLRPLLLFGILFVVFSEVVSVGQGVDRYPLMLLVGIVLFFSFSELTSGSVTAMVDREALVRKVSFPRMAVPLSVAVVASLNLLLNLVTVGIFVAVSAVEPRWSWLLLPLPLVALLILGVGVAMLLSALYVRFRDVRPIWDVTLQGLFYATPILYPIEKAADRSDAVAKALMCNPLAVIVQQFRHWLLGPGVPSAAEAIGGTAWLALPAAILVGVVALGFWVFEKMAPHMAEDL